MAAGAVFFFKYADRSAGVSPKQLAGDGEAHDSTADDEMVVFFQNGETLFHSGSMRSS